MAKLDDGDLPFSAGAPATKEAVIHPPHATTNTESTLNLPQKASGQLRYLQEEKFHRSDVQFGRSQSTKKSSTTSIFKARFPHLKMSLLRTREIWNVFLEWTWLMNLEKKGEQILPPVHFGIQQWWTYVVFLTEKTSNNIISMTRKLNGNKFPNRNNWI